MRKVRIAPIGVVNVEPVDHNSMLGLLLIFYLHSYPPAAPAIFIKRYDRLFDQIDEAVDQLDWAVVRDPAQATLTPYRVQRSGTVSVLSSWSTLVWLFSAA